MNAGQPCTAFVGKCSRRYAGKPQIVMKGCSFAWAVVLLQRTSVVRGQTNGVRQYKNLKVWPALKVKNTRPATNAQFQKICLLIFSNMWDAARMQRNFSLAWGWDAEPSTVHQLFIIIVCSGQCEEQNGTKHRTFQRFILPVMFQSSTHNWKIMKYIEDISIVYCSTSSTTIW